VTQIIHFSDAVVIFLKSQHQWLNRSYALSTGKREQQIGLVPLHRKKQ